MLTSSDIEGVMRDHIDDGLIMMPTKIKSSGVTLSASSKQYIKSELAYYSELPEPPSIHRLSQMLGYTPETLMRHAPEAVQSLMKRGSVIERLNHLRAEIEKALNEEPPPTQKEVIQRLQITQTERTSVLEELKMIAARWITNRDTITQNKQREKIRCIQETVRALYEEGTFPSKRKVYSRLGWNYASARNPVFRQAWEDALRELQHQPLPKRPD